MIDLRELYLIVAALYILQCGHIVKGTPFLFQYRWPGRWKALAGEPGFVLRNYRLLFGNIFPMLGQISICPRLEKPITEAQLRSDYAKTKKRFCVLGAGIGRIGFFSDLLFFVFFFYAPVLYFFLGPNVAFFGMAAMLFVLLIVTAWLYRRIHRKLNPEDRETRNSTFITLLGYLPAAMRARDALTSAFCSGCDPMVAAAVLCEREAFVTFAGQYLREKKFLYGETVEKYGFLTRKMKVQITDLLAPPQRLNSSTAAFCPVCLTQYMRTGNCIECREATLVAFSSSQEMIEKKVH